MHGHTFVAYLRVFQPLGAFPPGERARWSAYVGEGASLPAHVLVEEEERSALTRALGLRPEWPEREHALVWRHGRAVYLCPLRTELRRLQALLSFRQSVPEEAAGAFVSPQELNRAERALARLRREQPGVRSHIRQAAWYVPLVWFMLFDSSERQVIPARSGRLPRLTYATTLNQASDRIAKALKVLAERVEAVEASSAADDLREWLYGFSRDSFVTLDYGGLTQIIPFSELVEDHTARDVWEALTALEEGDLERSDELYSAITERWADLRGREARN
jgi:hypothetical protein